IGLLAGLDHRPHVGVQGCGEPAVGGGVGDAVEVGQQGGPTHVVELRTVVVAVGTGGRGDDNGRGVGGDQPGHGGLYGGKGVGARVVEDDRDELADGGE